MSEAKWGKGKTQAICAAVLMASTCFGVVSQAEAGSDTESLAEMRATIAELKKTVQTLEQKMAIMEENPAGNRQNRPGGCQRERDFKRRSEST